MPRAGILSLFARLFPVSVTAAEPAPMVSPLVPTADLDVGDFRLTPGSPASKVGFMPFDYSTAGVRPKDRR